MAARSLLLLAFFLTIEVIGAENNGLGLSPPLGWNTWCTEASCGQQGSTGKLHDFCNETEIKQVAEAMISNGMFQLGYKYVNLDDCWGATERAEDGSIQADTSRFPSGIKNLTDWLHSKGLLFGLYTSAGVATCSSGGRPKPIPGSYGHYEQDAKTFASWGVDYVKIDWCNTKVNGKELDPETVHTEFSKALNATGRPVFLNLCRGYSYPPPLYTSAVANSWRINGDHDDNWDSTSHVIELLAPLAKYAGPGGWNDPDFLMTGGAGCDQFNGFHCPGQSDTEYKTEFSIWSIAAASMLVATDIRNMTTIMQEILLNKEVLAVNQDKMRVAGGLVGFHDCSEGKQFCQIWARPLEGGSKAVVLYNAGKEDHDIVLDFDLLGWEGKTVMIRDLWAHKDLGSFTSEFETHVVSHGSTMLNLTLTA